MASYDPAQEYKQRLEDNSSRFQRLQRWDDLYANARLALFVLLAFTGWAVFSLDSVQFFWLAFPIALFAALVFQHARVIEEKDRAESLTGFYTRGLNRLAGKWKGEGANGAAYLPEKHPYANDLDLFGDGSLFQLLCAAQTLAGEETLAEWMCERDPLSKIKRRHEAIAELQHNLQLREDMFLLGGFMQAELHPRVLVAWAAGKAQLVPKPARILAITLSVTVVVSIIIGILFQTAAPFLISIILNMGLLGFYAKKIQKTSQEVTFPCRDLKVLARALARLEREQFTAPLLCELQQRLKDQDTLASRAIAILDRRVELLETQRNPMFIPVTLVLLWGLHFTHYIEHWRAHWGPRVQVWLHALGDLEALLSLAQFTYEHPEYPFPEFNETDTVYNGEEIGHPLIPAQERIHNSVQLDDSCRMYMISGSNMSGKSTLLRTVGINAILAQMGAPVCAKSLQLRPVKVCATLHVQDSIQQGASRFYAEILRLKQFMDLAQQMEYPVLFLLDEILHGTNSHDRSIGAKALLSGYLKHGAIGLVSTHDLAITETIDQLGAPAKNAHFEDHIEGGKLHFDYRLKPGVVQKSNALDLMREIGIDI